MISGAWSQHVMLCVRSGRPTLGEAGAVDGQVAVALAWYSEEQYSRLGGGSWSSCWGWFRREAPVIQTEMRSTAAQPSLFPMAVVSLRLLQLPLCRLRASDIMEPNLTYVYPHTRIQSLVSILRTTVHHAFPVVTENRGNEKEFMKGNQLISNNIKFKVKKMAQKEGQ